MTAAKLPPCMVALMSRLLFLISKMFSKIISRPELETGINSDIPWIADKNKILIR